MHEPAVRAVLARWFPGRAIAVERARSGTSTPVFRVRIDGEIHYARLAEDPGERRDAEVAVHRRLAAEGIPVPDVVRYEARPPELDRSLALTQRVPGVPIAELPSMARLADACPAAGCAVAAVNAIPVRGYGWVASVTDDDALRAEHETRAAWVAEYLAAAEIVMAARVLASDVAAHLRAAIDAWAAMPASLISHLAHGDLDATHVYVDPASGVFTGIIDFGEIRGADRLYDLGHLLLHDGEAGRPRLLRGVVAGYASMHPLPDGAMVAIRLHAIAIGTRALAIQLRRAPSPYRERLARRLEHLATSTTDP